MTKVIRLVFILLISHQLNYAQQAQIDSINNFIESTLQKFQEIPSLSITVIKNNQPFFTKTYGYANVERSSKANNETAYYIASTTKSYVGLLAAQLESEGALDLSRPITEYAPIKQFKNKDLFKGITITDLLSHTSGLENPMLSMQFSSIGDYTRTDLVKILEEETISLFNNKSYHYTNFGYNVFDLILYEEFRENWKDLLQERIFKPMKMQHTTAYLSVAEKQDWSLAQPYTAINDERLPTLASTRKNDATFQAAGGLVSSIEDAQKWLLINMNQGQLDGETYFKKEAIEKAQSKIAKVRGQRADFIDTHYGLGWNHARFGEHEVLHHSGGFDGYFSQISFMPNENMGIAIFSNESHFGDNIGKLIVSYVYQLLLGEISSAAEIEKEIAAVEKRVNALQNAFQRDRQKRATRKWKLSYPFQKYAGIYQHPHLGKFQVHVEKEEIRAQLGISKNIGTPARHQDAVRIEFRDGRGEDLQFIFYKEQAIAIIYGGHVFYRKE